MAEHPIERVQRAIVAGAAGAELNALRTQRLARRTAEPEPTELPDALAQIQALRPDRTRFDHLLTAGEPAQV